MTASYRSTFGGIVYDSDFNTNYKKGNSSKTGSDLASRIMRDQRFDEQCRQQIHNRDCLSRKGGSSIVR